MNEGRKERKKGKNEGIVVEQTIKSKFHIVTLLVIIRSGK